MRNPIDLAAVKVVEFVRKNNPEAASKEVLTYSTIIAINTLVALLISLVICVITGNFLNFVLVYVIFTVLRYFTGGVHLNSSLSCCLFTIAVFVSVVHIKYDYGYIGYFLDAFSFLMIAWKAPHKIDVVKQVSSQKKMFIKILCLFFVSTNFLLQSTLLSSILLVQAMSFTQWFENLVNIERSHVNEKDTGSST